jgi:large conductance mechanosensitive channel
MWKEFREFAFKGNVIDLAVAVVIAAAFGAIIKSFVDDIIMPLLSVLTGGVSFNDLFISLDGKSYPSRAAAEAAGAATLNYGAFINSIITFLIIAFAIFIVIKVYNTATKNTKDPDKKTCPYCQSEVPIPATKCAFCTSELPAAA